MDLPQKPAFRAWMLPSWLGLDAPCVVCTWAWAVSRALDQTLRPEVYAALFLACWAIYLGDRLIDVARCRDWSQVTGRMRFGRRFRTLFAVCLGLVFAGLVALLVSGRVAQEAVRGFWVGLGVLGYGALFVAPAFSREKLPGKEFGVGIGFAAAIWAAFGAVPGICASFGGLRGRRRHQLPGHRRARFGNRWCKRSRRRIAMVAADSPKPAGHRHGLACCLWRRLRKRSRFTRLWRLPSPA